MTEAQAAELILAVNNVGQVVGMVSVQLWLIAMCLLFRKFYKD